MTSAEVQALLAEFGEENLVRIFLDNPRHVLTPRELGAVSFDHTKEELRIEEYVPLFETGDYRSFWVITVVPYEHIQGMSFIKDPQVPPPQPALWDKLTMTIRVEHNGTLVTDAVVTVYQLYKDTSKLVNLTNSPQAGVFVYESLFPSNYEIDVSSATYGTAKKRILLTKDDLILIEL